MVFGILTEQWWICAAAGASLLFTIISRIYMARKAFRTFNVSISLWKIIPFELASCWKQLFSFIRFCRADKYDFTSHKLRNHFGSFRHLVRISETISGVLDTPSEFLKPFREFPTPRQNL